MKNGHKTIREHLAAAGSGIENEHEDLKNISID